MKALMKLTANIKKDQVYFFLFLLTIASSLGYQGWRTLFNNFAVDKVGLNGFTVGAVQSFSELPGFLSFTAVLVFLFMREQKLASVSVIILGIGVLITGLFPTFLGLLVTTFIMSTGYHYFQTANQALILQCYNKKESPGILAGMKSATAVANISVGVFILIMSAFLSYAYNYAIIGIAVVLITIVAFKYSPKKNVGIPQKRKMILKKRYWMFYALNFLDGARRQIFMVFAVFLLVENYHFTIQEVTLLFIINNIIAIIANPYIAKLINHWGEKRTLTLEFVSLTLIFISYAYFDHPYVAACLYVMDSIFFNFSIGINTYFQKHANPADISPSMAVGFTINHIAAITLPVIGGALWLINWRIPFIIACGLCIVSIVVVQFMKNSIVKEGNKDKIKPKGTCARLKRA